MTGTLRHARRAAGAIRRRIFPSPEMAAWRHARHIAETTPRYTPGTIRLMEYELQYADLRSLCPQWHDIFLRRGLDFDAPSAAPRILDCGANVGLASLFFKCRYPRARITAYEADPTLFAMLSANLKANRAADVEAVHAALWTQTGTLTFHCEGGDSGAIASLAAGAPGAEAAVRTVPSLRLRDILAAERIDLLKLDIEGAEDAVLADCEPALDHIPAILLDLHEFNPAVRQAPRVLERLTRAGFTYAVDELVAQPWRPPVAGPRSPFPGKALAWSMSVRAWRTAT